MLCSLCPRPGLRFGSKAEIPRVLEIEQHTGFVHKLLVLLGYGVIQGVLLLRRAVKDLSYFIIIFLSEFGLSCEDLSNDYLRNSRKQWSPA